MGQVYVRKFLVFSCQKLQPIKTSVGQLIMLQTQLHQIPDPQIGSQNLKQGFRSHTRLAHRNRMNLVFEHLEEIHCVIHRLVIYDRVSELETMSERNAAYQGGKGLNFL